ncbi:10742_t:CDS:2 [Dentiscutata erythropus]|uniref:10742_t:CDS:1 n=1 Tax=Dentiscutata erythropus TaxID=1348616 RepID=A0A9N9DR39_9GLOM|nr:10742_t:CDS:2 [Dentiscutata erythropus]
MYKLLVANKDQIVDIFQEFVISDEDRPWRLASLNHNYSNIAEEDWCSAEENTNVVELAYADANREKIQMSLLLAIRNIYC